MKNYALFMLSLLLLMGCSKDVADEPKELSLVGEWTIYYPSDPDGYDDFYDYAFVVNKDGTFTYKEWGESDKVDAKGTYNYVSEDKIEWNYSWTSFYGGNKVSHGSSISTIVSQNNSSVKLLTVVNNSTDDSENGIVILTRK